MKNRLLIFCIICVSVFVLSGCSSPTPAKHEYRLQSDIKIFKSVKTSCATQTLKVDRAFGAREYSSLKMYYVIGKYTQYAYANSRWAQSVNDAVTKEIVEYLREITLFKSVQNANSKTANDMRLEITIDDFMHYFDENEKNSYVNVIITCNLIDENTHKTVAIKTFHVNMKTDSDDARGGVIALNKALERIVKECGLWLKGVCIDRRKRV